MKIISVKQMSLMVGLFIALACIAPACAMADEGTDLGGWSESEGYYSLESAIKTNDSIALYASPVHRGESQRTSINGTTNKRAHGWTSWSGVYHYTTAQLEHSGLFCSGVITSSGRQWGWNNTEAYSPWKAFNPNACCSGYGQARTYYGS